SPISTLFPYTTLFRSGRQGANQFLLVLLDGQGVVASTLKENLLGGLQLSVQRVGQRRLVGQGHFAQHLPGGGNFVAAFLDRHGRSEEHTSELQSRSDL